MNEIEKMYKNAGVKLRKVCTNVNCDCDEMFCDECEYFKDNIFAFTAEKQLELIKFMLHKGIYYDTDGDTYWFHYTDEIENAKYRPFEEAIAEFINGFWQDLTEEEKEQIRGILE